ncbi:AI-2E family transporter [Candidatus Azambacteria bacterium]|nr:AI-2E family transporter [Candidatus Azambacteria bacterium]
MLGQKQSFDIRLSVIIKVVLVLLGFVFLYLIKEVLAILFLAIIIASAVDPWVGFFEKYYVPRLVGVFLVYLVIFGALATVFYSIIPPIIDEIKQFAVVLPDYYDTVSKQIFRTTRGISPDWAKDAQGFLIAAGEQIKSYTSGVVRAISGLFGGVVAFGAVVVISFYLAVQQKGVDDFLRLVTPKEEESYVLDLWKRVEHKLGRWFQGQLLLGCIVGLTVFVGLSIIGVPYALLLGVIAAVFEIVPMVGPLFSALFGITVAVLISPFLAALTLLFYVIVQQIENHVLVPLLMKRITGLNPVVVIVALLIGAQLGGVLGMLLAVPIATVAGELLEDLAKKKSAPVS